MQINAKWRNIEIAKTNQRPVMIGFIYWIIQFL